jgi:uroporphyrinogen-III synthase
MKNARIVLLESRMRGELARLVERHGGVPIVAPAVDEAAIEDDAHIAPIVDGLVGGRFDIAIFLTGAGVTHLIDAAARLGRREPLLVALRALITVCRGPKPAAVLRKEGIVPTLLAAEPYTTVEVLDAIASLDLSGRKVALIHYGERNAMLAETLRAREANVEELCLYEWRLPADRAPLEQVIDAIVRGEIDAIAFTSQVQVRHLLQVAKSGGALEALVDALRGRIAVASVGPTCTAALVAMGLHADVEPEHPKMGPMVSALARHLASRAGPPRESLAPSSSK